MGSISGIEFCDNLCYFKNSLFIGGSRLCRDLLTYDNGCTLMYLCLRAQIEMLYENKGLYRGLTQYEICATYLLIVVSPWTKRVTDRGKQTISCLSESIPTYKDSIEDWKCMGTKNSSAWWRRYGTFYENSESGRTWETIIMQCRWRQESGIRASDVMILIN